MAKTLSGHPALLPFDPRLRTRGVPGRPIRLRAHRAALPLMLRLSVLLDQVIPLHAADSGSYAYRKPRTDPAGSRLSDHAGWAVEHWSTREGRQGFPTSMTASQAARISAILRRFATPDGRLVLGWGASDRSPGVDYPITYHRLSDPMHVHVAPGITVADLRAVAAAMRIRPDGTIQPGPIEDKPIEDAP